jgi:hypothetical protein
LRIELTALPGTLDDGALYDTPDPVLYDTPDALNDTLDGESDEREEYDTLDVGGECGGGSGTVAGSTLLFILLRPVTLAVGRGVYLELLLTYALVVEVNGW